MTKWGLIRLAYDHRAQLFHTSYLGAAGWCIYSASPRTPQEALAEGWEPVSYTPADIDNWETFTFKRAEGAVYGL